MLAGFALALLTVAGATAADLSQQDRADIARVTDYLDNMRSLTADFIQAGSSGQISEGKLYVRRPGRLRFEYAPPSPLLLIGDGIWVALYDREIDQISRWPISETPLGVLVDDKVDLSKRAEVTEVTRRPGILALTIIDRDKPDEGSVTVVFSDPPLTLRQWRILDAQGTTVDVAVHNLKPNIDIDPSLFVIQDKIDEDPSKHN